MFNISGLHLRVDITLIVCRGQWKSHFISNMYEAGTNIVPIL